MNYKLQKKLNRNIGLDYLSVFIQNMNMQSCIWVLYLSYCGMNLGQIGILEGVYHITSMLFMVEVPIEKHEKKEENAIRIFVDYFKSSATILKENRNILKVIIFFQGIFTAQTILFFYSQQYFYDMGYNKIWISMFMLAFAIQCCTRSSQVY